MRHKYPIFLFFLMACIAIALFLVPEKLHQPFAPALVLPTVSTPTSPSEQQTIHPTLSEEPPQSDPQAGTCGRTGTMTILVVGSDYRGTDYLYGLADVIRILRVDFDHPALKVLAIPRDLWVRIPGLSARNIEYGKINQAYFFGTPGMGYYQGSAGGAGLLAETLYENFGVFPDHYIVVSMAIVAETIDLIGGVDITLKEPVDGNFVLPDGSSQRLGYFFAGSHHLTGEQALRLMRIRFGYSDNKRIDNQTLVLNALWNKIKGSPSLQRRIAFYGSKAILEKKVLTDFSVADISLFTCLIRQVQAEKVQFVTVPPDTMQASIIYSTIQRNRVFVYLPDTKRFGDVLQRFWAGTWP